MSQVDQSNHKGSYMGKMEAEEAELERWQGEKDSGQHCWLRI